MLKKLIVFTVLLICFMPIWSKSKIVYDDNKCEIHELFNSGSAKYVIKYTHFFEDTLYVPCNSVIHFDGGRLTGPMVFQNTRITGNVNIKGSSIKGTISNKYFDASWICYMNGISDDAPSINEAIAVSDTVFFPKGIYRLISAFDAKGKVPDDCLSSFKCHLGIGKSDVILIGEEGTIFETYEKSGILCIYSQPRQIEQSTSNILIDGITFKIHNDRETYLGLVHTIKMMGVNGITIKNCKFDDFWGDAICLSHYGDSPVTGERSRNQNVQIINNTIKGGDHHNTRNGISIINGKNVIIKNNRIISTSRKDKPGGIDIEPNNSAYTIENIQILSNYFEDIWGAGGAIGVCVYDGGPAYRITIKGNKICKSIEGIQLYIMTENTTSDFEIKNNIIKDVEKPLSFEGEGSSRNWTISGNSFHSIGKQKIPGKIRVSNLSVRKNRITN